MFGFIGRLVGCVFGRTEIQMNEQKKEISGLKVALSDEQRKRKKSQERADMEWNRSEMLREEMSKEREANRELNIAKEKIFLESERIDRDREKEVSDRKKKPVDKSEDLADDLVEKIEKRQSDKLSK